MPKVSIILPCYNVEKYIAKSIQSVLDQTYADFELLVVIDGSPDNSKAIAETFQDSRIHIYEKTNGGLSDARNYGLERANGEFVYFMDSDDWIESSLLEKSICVLEEENLNLVIFGYIQDDEDVDGNLTASHVILPNTNVIHKLDENKELGPNILGLMGYAWNKVYRRSFLIANHFVFEKGTSLIEDILFNAQLYHKLDKLRFINEAFYHYLNRPSATLIKQYHSDSFELKLRRNRVLQALFNEWAFSNKDSIVAASHIGGIRYCLHNMFYFKNNLSFYEKKEHIKEMIQHPFTKEVINNFAPKTLKDKVFKVLIKYEQAFLLAILAQLKK